MTKVTTPDSNAAARMAHSCAMSRAMERCA